MSKIGSHLGPQHGGNERTFSLLKPSWLHLGAILPPTRPQDPPRGHLGAILEPSWCHFGVIFLRKLSHLGPFNHLSVYGSAPSPSPFNHLPLDQLLVNFNVCCGVVSCGVGVGLLWCKRGGGVGQRHWDMKRSTNTCKNNENI